MWRGFTKKQWDKIQPHLPVRKRNPKGGRPWAKDKKALEGILWILWTGAPWSELPKRYGSPSTCWRRLRQWSKDDTFLNLWRAFLSELNDQAKVRWDECFLDGTFAPAKKGAKKWAKRSEAREQRLWYWQMARVLRSEFTWRRLPRQR